MGIYFIDETKRLSGFQKWKNYEEFKKQVEGNGLLCKVWGALLLNKHDKKAFKKFHSKVGELYRGLEEMIENRKHDPTLWTFQADTIIYKKRPYIDNFIEETSARPEGYIWARKEIPERYLLGIDVCIMGEDDWNIARDVAKPKGIIITSWRAYHGSFVKDVKELENPNKILDTILEFGEVHNKIGSALTTKYFLEELHPK